MKSITIDLRDVDNIDIQGRGKAPGGAPPRKKLGAAEKTALGAAIDIWTLFSPRAVLFRDPMVVSDTSPSVTVKKPSSVPVGMTPRPKDEVTLALGMATTAFAAVGASVSGGGYGSTNGELGVYTGGSVGSGPTSARRWGPSPQ